MQSSFTSLKKTTRSFVARIYERSPFFSRSHYYRTVLRVLRPAMKGKSTFELLEVGAFKGGSASVWAKECERSGFGHITCVDWWIDEAIYRDFLRVARQHPCISYTKGNSNDVLPRLPKDHFDFIFVDGGHSYSQTKLDILNSAPLLKDGGILCGDDLDFQLHEVDKEEAMAHQEEEGWRSIKHDGTGYHPGVTVAIAELFGDPIRKERVFWAFQKGGSGWRALL
jgi:predicted O-methyltransferase YrrM